MNLGNLIDNAVKEMTRQEEKEEDDDEDEDLTLDDLNTIKQEIIDADFEEYNEFLEQEQLSDEEIIKKGTK